jgi:hypothetical protein
MMSPLRSFLVALLAASCSAPPLLGAPSARLELVPIDQYSFAAVVTSDGPYLGGEICLGYRSAEMVPVDIVKGEDFPAGKEFPGGEPSLFDFFPFSISTCPADPAIDSGLVVRWIHPRNPAGGLRALPPGRHEVLVIHFSPGPEAAGRCHILKPLDCLGPAEAPVQNVITASTGESVPLTAFETFACDTGCFRLAFSPGAPAACREIVLDLRDEDRTTSLGTRRATVEGLTGFDAARALFLALQNDPVTGFTTGLDGSTLQICRQGGARFRVFLDEIEQRPWGAKEVEGSKTIKVCSIDVTGEVPSCLDSDGDGICDGSDTCPNVPNPLGPCPGTGFCRILSFSPSGVVQCSDLRVALREPDGTVIRSVPVVLPSIATGLDLGRAVHAALAGAPPAGFAFERTPLGFSICRSDVRPFRIFLLRVEDGVAMEDELTETAAAFVCLVRAWVTPPDCAMAGGDADGDGVCDAVDLCPAFNPSQADADADCEGDACQSGKEPFAPDGLCGRLPKEIIAPDGSKPWSFDFTRCERAACVTFDAPPGKPVALLLENPKGLSTIALSVKIGGPPSHSDNDAFARGQGTVRLVLPSASDSTNYVRVQAERYAGPSQVTLTVRSVDLSLQSIAPARGPHGGRASVVILGGGFETGRTVFRLVPESGGDAIEPWQLAIISSGRAEAVFYLPPPEPGAEEMPVAYHLEAMEDGIEGDGRPDFLAVPPGEAYGLEVTLTGQSRYRRGPAALAMFRVRNIGPEEVTAPLLEVTAPPWIRLRLPREGEYHGNGEVGDVLHVLAAAGDGFAGRIPPGGTVEIPVILENQDETCTSCAATFEVRLFAPLPGDFISWGTLAPPQGMIPGDWERSWPGLISSLGTRWIDFHEGLAGIATRLARRGSDPTSALGLFRFAVREALGAPGAAVIGEVIDSVSLEPLPDVRVVALDGDKVIWSALTDSRGTFALEGLPKGERCRIEVDSRAGGVDAEIPETGDLLGLRLFVSPGGIAHEEAAPPPEVALPAALPSIPRELFTKIAEFRTTFVGAWDPNEKYGIDGEGDEGLIGLGTPIVYTIYFENRKDAGAAAQTVVIIDTIHPNLDFSSIRILDTGIGGRVYPLVYMGPDRYTGYLGSGIEASTYFQVEPNPVFEYECDGTDFRLTVNLNERSRTITWTFETLDCESRGPVPVTSDFGFLPKNDPRPQGEGFVSFSILPESDLADESPIFNIAEIRFDSQATIYTKAVENVLSYFLPADPPEDPNPPVACDNDSTRPVPISSTLCWAPCKRARRYDVYLWKEGETGPGAPAAEGIMSPCFRPPAALEHDTVYRWQVVARDIRDVRTPGEIWCFRTEPLPPPCPAAPSNLRVPEEDCSPEHGPLLEWDGIEKATYVLFWARDGSPLEPKATTAETTFRVPLLPAGTYDWAVVAMNESCPDPDLERKSEEAEFYSCGPFFKRGDADRSGKLDITDPVATLQFLYMGYAAPLCKDAADTDDSGILDLTDAITSLQFLFMGGPPPAAPGPYECGPDPTPEDQYTDCEYIYC